MDNRKKASRMRQIIAKNMANSWKTSPKCDFFMNSDTESMMEFRRAYNLENKCNISFLSMVMKAAALALKEYPLVNSRFDADTNEHIMNSHINVGFAMAIDDGLIALNVKDADQLSVSEISNKIDELIEKAKNKKLSTDDVTGGSITVNNMGQYSRLEEHTAIINQPELSILSIYAIKEKPEVHNGEIVIQKQMKLALSADHRVIDGKMACEFLDMICRLIENPGSLLQ
jgi:pyruvate dehydrogenase E2 component (dihydrolipoamide acetyltransferase)